MKSATFTREQRSAWGRLMGNFGHVIVDTDAQQWSAGMEAISTSGALAILELGSRVAADLVWGLRTSRG